METQFRVALKSETGKSQLCPLHLMSILNIVMTYFTHLNHCLTVYNKFCY